MRLVVLLGTAFLCAPLAARAASGGAAVLIAHSGYLLDGSDRPVTAASLPVTFRLSNLATTGVGEVLTWTASCTVDVADGYFATVLGAVPCVGDGLDTADFPAGADRYLSLTVDGVELLPRPILVPAGVATVARDADRLGNALPATFHDAALLTGTVPAAALGNAVQAITAAPGGPLSVGGTANAPVLAFNGPLATGLGGTGLLNAGAAGNFLRSDGTAWTSQAIAATDLPSLSGTYVDLSGTQSVSGAKTFSNLTVTGGTMNNTVIGGTTPAAITGTTITGTTITGTSVTGATVTASTKVVSGTVDTGAGTTLSVTSGGATQFQVQQAASAANYVTVTGAATAGAPSIAAAGTDANVPLTLKGKGTGPVQIASGYVENATACAVSTTTTVIPNNPAVQVYCYTLNAATTIQLPQQSALGLSTTGVWNLTLALKQGTGGGITPAWQTAGGSGDLLKWDGSTNTPAVATTAGFVTLFQCITTAVLPNQWYCAKVFTQN